MTSGEVVDAVQRPAHGTLLERARIRPVGYAAGMLAAFVLDFLVVTGVSPYAAGRPLLIAVAAGLALPWLLALWMGDRDRAGALALALLGLLVAGPRKVVLVLILAAIVLLLVEWVMSRRRRSPVPWHVVTRGLTVVAVILLLAVGIKAVQDGRIAEIGSDVVAEAPAPFRATPSATAGTPVPPDITLILLDGYPRPDKLASEFGFDDAAFIERLETDGFLVADHSRSNYPLTRMTLATMLNGAHVADLFPDGNPGAWDWRRAIGEGRVLDDLRGVGYEIVSISSGFEVVSLRAADRFVDTGQLNEFEWVLLQMTGAATLLDAVAPDALAENHRLRVTSSFGAAAAEVSRDGPPRFTLVHVLSPHSPVVFGPGGEPVDPGPVGDMFGDSLAVEHFGPEQYARRIGDQVTYLNGQVLELLDAIERGGRPSVVVAFSDHGSGVRYVDASPADSDMDMRTANLLAVRTPDGQRLVDDRSTLVNVLSRIARTYAGVGPADVPEDIHLYGADNRYHGLFERPD